MKLEQFKSIMQGIMEMYPGRYENIGSLAMEIWYECLKDMDYDVTKESIVNHVNTSKFPPTVADIRERYSVLILREDNLTKEIDRIFTDMRNRYPNGSNDDSAYSIFHDCLSKKDIDCRVDYADAIKNTVVDYVERCELGLTKFDKTFSECIKWATEG